MKMNWVALAIALLLAGSQDVRMSFATLVPEHMEMCRWLHHKFRQQ